MKNASFFNAFIFLSLLVIVWGCQPVTKESTPSAFQITSGKKVTKATPLIFPQDHGIHEEQGIEWWYLTANLESTSGETFGVQWTLFRSLMPNNIQSTWWDNNLYFAHFAMQHDQQHVAFERFARANQAQVISSPFTASIDDWQLRSTSHHFLPLKLNASQNDHAVALTLTDSPITLHGENGYSQKTESGHASYYFSYPFLKVSGKLTFAGQVYDVSGNAWYDREWSASLLDRNQLGWDWFSIISDESPKHGLMLFCIRGSEQSYDYCNATQINPNGEATSVAKENIDLTVLETVSLEGKKYPSKWRIKLKGSPEILVESITKDSRNRLTIPYWEGRVQASGGFSGKGYAELTGY